MPSGISCSIIARATPYPNSIDTSNPEPIAKPSGYVQIRESFAQISFNLLKLNTISICLF